MKLYGTTTSPFVRRVRIVAAEVGEPIEWVNTVVEAGKAALRELSPIWKVPVAIFDGRVVFDSKVISEWLTTTRGHGALTPPRDVFRERNLVNAVDEAIGSIIMLFQARRDGVSIDDGNPFVRRQIERTDAIFSWLGKELSPHDFGLPELSAICALDWMDFRSTYPTERAAGLAALRAAWRERPSVASTYPHT